MAACYLEPRRLHGILFCTTTFLCWFLFFRLDGFGLPLGGAHVVFRVLLEGHNPQDVATSLGGRVGLISNRQLILDAGRTSTTRRGRLGNRMSKGSVIFLAVSGRSSEVTSNARSRSFSLRALASCFNLIIHRCKWIFVNISSIYLKNNNKHVCT